MSDVYKEEVNELTSLLRDDDDWYDLRDILTNRGFDLNKIALVAFNEDDDESEFGVIVDNNHKVFVYLRSNNVGSNETVNFDLSEITDEEDQRIKYPQIKTAIEMFDKNLI